jgi:mono/diheme cytochrome c family protein
MRHPLVLAVLLLVACTGATDPAPGPIEPYVGPGDVARGRQIYLASCTACHNADPSLAGPVGPALRGSSRELVEARVIRGAYPPEYTPKRSTSLMQALPQLKGNVDDLTAYLH